MTLNYNIKTFAQIDSTMDKAAQELDDTAVEGLVIHAMSQEQGRGRQGKHWHAPMGNLYLSIVLSPAIEKKDCGQLAFVCACALVEAVTSLCDKDIDIRVKWPNDVLVDGKKIAGILIESKGDAYIAGIGLNILAPPEGAIGLKDITDKRVPINPVRDFLLDVLDAYYTRWLKEGFEVIQKTWMEKAAFLDEEIAIKLSEKEETGIFKGIDKNGCLLLEQNGDIQTFYSGEIYSGAGAQNP